MVKILISFNISLLAKDIAGRKPEDIAKKKKCNEILAILFANKRRSAQHVSRAHNHITETKNNTLSSLFRMKTRISKNIMIV